MQFESVVKLAVQFFTQSNAAPAVRPPLAQEIRQIQNDPEALTELGRRRGSDVRSLLQEAHMSLPGASPDRINAFAASLISISPNLFAVLHDSGQGPGALQLPAYSELPRPGEMVVNMGTRPVPYSERPQLGHNSLSAVPLYSEFLPEGHDVAESDISTRL